jgi:5'-methylthioadenosine phosphorylase
MTYKGLGYSVIGMTNLPEAKLAREAELCFATLALATDYDCWHDAHDDVTVDAVVATMKKNVVLAKQALVHLAGSLPDPTKSIAHGASRGAVMTHPAAISAEARARLGWLLPHA